MRTSAPWMVGGRYRGMDQKDLVGALERLTEDARSGRLLVMETAIDREMEAVDIVPGRADVRPTGKETWTFRVMRVAE